MTRRDPGRTRKKLLDAAAQLFAAHGFHGTTAREIAERGGVNLAAGHYHFGSKKDLYLEVLRAQFARIQATMAARGALPPSDVKRLSRAEARTTLRNRVQVMLDLLLGPPIGLHGTLMQREMTDPSEALPVIVDEFVAPQMDELCRLIRCLAPQLDAETVDRCARSIVAQVVFYRFCMPVALRILGWKRYPEGFARDMAEHITAFSLGGLAAVRPRRRLRAPR
ncbi:MAG: CerR family C-terminal domain-containing protein [bacterium]|nr:CerR family C-terminal domain-containing protein [bacterium]